MGKHLFLVIGLLAVICLSGLFAGLPADGAHADTFYVREGGTGSGSSWADASGDLRSIIDCGTSGDEIWVAAGTYTPVAAGQTGTRTDTFQLRGNIIVAGGFSNTGSPAWWDRDSTVYKTVLSGEILNPGTTADNCYHVLYASGSVTAILDGFTITGGNASPKGIRPIMSVRSSQIRGTFESPASRKEADKAPAGAAPQLRNYDGGGMLNLGGASPTVYECIFINNSAWNTGGGMSNWDSSPTIVRCNFRYNNAVNTGGGGMYNSYSSPVIEITFFSLNTGFVGGGIYNYYHSSPSIIDCGFWNNIANDYGGGMENENNCSPDIFGCNFVGNQGQNYGGGMENYSSCHPTIDNCSFFGNAASDGGGMSIYEGSNPQITNCTFVENNASNGGGIYNTLSNPNIVNCTLFGNTADTNAGGGFHISDGMPEIVNSIIWANTSGTPAMLDSVFIGGGTPTFSYCDIQVSPGSPVFPGIGNINQDPLLTNPGCLNLHLHNDSPCIDAGTNSAILGTGITEDFEGDNRIINGTVDMGIDEVSSGTQGYYLTVTSGTGGQIIQPGFGGGVSGPYPAGSNVAMEVQYASPCSCYTFSGWTGDIGTVTDPDAMSTIIVMNADYAVDAGFNYKACKWDYDTSGNCKISYVEMVDALMEYLLGNCSYKLMVDVLMQYLMS